MEKERAQAPRATANLLERLLNATLSALSPADTPLFTTYFPAFYYNNNFISIFPPSSRVDLLSTVYLRSYHFRPRHHYLLLLTHPIEVPSLFYHLLLAVHPIVVGSRAKVTCSLTPNQGSAPPPPAAPPGPRSAPATLPRLCARSPTPPPLLARYGLVLTSSFFTCLLTRSPFSKV